jgi:CBS domain-containing protein
MKNKPKLAEIMTTNPEVVETSQPISEVYDLFQNRDYHHIPVVDGRSPVGIISATDILKLVYDIDGNDDRMLRTFLDHQFTIDDAMSTDLVTLNKNAMLRDAVDAMAPGNIHSVLVVDDGGQLEGIVTSTDLIRVLGSLL